MATPSVSARHLVGPVVVGIRGPSRSGKSTLCSNLIEEMRAAGFTAAWLKRTHHAIDLPGKSSDRIWERRPQATMLLADDRLAVTLPPCGEAPVELIKRLPVDVDVVLLETHTPVDFPTVLSRSLDPAEGENVIERWTPGTELAAGISCAHAIAQLVPRDRTVDAAIRAAMRLHGGHGCAGLILGARLALAGSAALGVLLPDTRKRLIVVAETDRCALDALQAVTGCKPGKRTLRTLDYGKLAATFIDQNTGRSVRVAARGDLRARVGASGPGRHELQRAAYATWPANELFSVAETNLQLAQYDMPGPPRVRVLCVACGEEVSDARHKETESGPVCLPCASATAYPAQGASQ
jgi:formylmethanofuran dehydrogenase subunit E